MGHTRWQTHEVEFPDLRRVSPRSVSFPQHRHVKKPAPRSRRQCLHAPKISAGDGSRDPSPVDPKGLSPLGARLGAASANVDFDLHLLTPFHLLFISRMDSYCKTRIAIFLHDEEVDTIPQGWFRLASPDGGSKAAFALGRRSRELATRSALPRRVMCSTASRAGSPTERPGARPHD